MRCENVLMGTVFDTTNMARKKHTKEAHSEVAYSSGSPTNVKSVRSVAFAAETSVSSGK